MKSRIATTLGVATAALLLAACNSGGYGSDNTPAADGYGNDTPAASATPSATAEPSTSAASGGDTATTGASLMTMDSDLGTIVTDADGMVVYQFDSDTQGSGMSSCTGDCLANWPVVPGGDSAAMLEGITGEVTTITGTDGKPQLALNGWPLYYYAGDSAAGDMNGQGVGGIWWVIGPDGEPIHD